MPEITITGFVTRDVRFPTSLDKTGSDAMNAAGDYSAAYCILKTDSDHTGHGMVSLPHPPKRQNVAKVRSAG
jgi:L-galactonate dehydratase